MADHVGACSHGRKLNWPPEIWIGIHDSEWPIRAFAHPDQAADWVGDDPKSRHAFRVDGSITAEVRFVPPVPASYEVIPVAAEVDR
jgi:hypothetical protein